MILGILAQQWTNFPDTSVRFICFKCRFSTEQSKSKVITDSTPLCSW